VEASLQCFADVGALGTGAEGDDVRGDFAAANGGDQRLERR
jgi:hypothetical protein